ncbi:hypothetical protein BMR86_25910, partial [Stenotrophomonas sp. KAs 5-3]
ASLFINRQQLRPPGQFARGVKRRWPLPLLSIAEVGLASLFINRQQLRPPGQFARGVKRRWPLPLLSIA